MVTPGSTWGFLRWKVAVGGVVALAVSGVVAALALTGPAAAVDRGFPSGWPTQLVKSSHAVSQRAGAASEVIRVRERELRNADVDIDGDGSFDPGDFTVFEGELLDTATGDTVGREAAQCGRVIKQFSCEGTFLLKGRGKITIAGVFFRGEKALTLAITGGTREFRGARGTFSVGGNGRLLILTLVGR